MLETRKTFDRLPITADEAYTISRRELERRPLRWNSLTLDSLLMLVFSPQHEFDSLFEQDDIDRCGRQISSCPRVQPVPFSSKCAIPPLKPSSPFLSKGPTEGEDLLRLP